MNNSNKVASESLRLCSSEVSALAGGGGARMQQEWGLGYLAPQMNLWFSLAVAPYVAASPHHHPVLSWPLEFTPHTEKAAI